MWLKGDLACCVGVATVHKQRAVSIMMGCTTNCQLRLFSLCTPRAEAQGGKGTSLDAQEGGAGSIRGRKSTLNANTVGANDNTVAAAAEEEEERALKALRAQVRSYPPFKIWFCCSACWFQQEIS